jgi:hypothetical protein
MKETAINTPSKLIKAGTDGLSRYVASLISNGAERNKAEATNPSTNLLNTAMVVENPVQTCSIINCAKSTGILTKCTNCENDFHLTCVGLKKRPSVKTKWNCPDCKNDTAEILKKLSHAVESFRSTLSKVNVEQTKLKEQQQALKTENTQLKTQVIEMNIPCQFFAFHGCVPRELEKC